MLHNIFANVIFDYNPHKLSCTRLIQLIYFSFFDLQQSLRQLFQQNADILGLLRLFHQQKL